MWGFLLISCGLCAQILKPTTWQYSNEWLAKLWIRNTPVLLRGGPSLINTSLDNFFAAFEDWQFAPTIGSLDEEGRFIQKYTTSGLYKPFRETKQMSYAKTPYHPESSDRPKTRLYTMSKLAQVAKFCGRKATKRKRGQSESSVIRRKCYYSGTRFDVRGNGYKYDERRFINIEAVTPGGDVGLLRGLDVQMFLSSARNTIVPPHFDHQVNLFYHLRGPKTFYLLPPGQAFHPMHSSLSTLHRQLARETIANHKFVTKVELEPGDYLLIPPFWAHEVHAVSAVSAMATSIALWSRPRFWESYPKLKPPYWMVFNGGEDMVLEALGLSGLDYLEDDWLPERRAREVVALLNAIKSEFEFYELQHALAERLYLGWDDKVNKDGFGCLFSQQRTIDGNSAALQLFTASPRMPRSEILRYAESLLHWATALGDVIDFSNLCAMDVQADISSNASASVDEDVCTD